MMDEFDDTVYLQAIEDDDEERPEEDEDEVNVELGADLSYRDLRESVDNASRVASFEVVEDRKLSKLPITFGLNDKERSQLTQSTPREAEYQRFVIVPSEGALAVRSLMASVRWCIEQRLQSLTVEMQMKW
jgi:hypothetical protein